jgi:hypothetical protein
MLCYLTVSSFSWSHTNNTFNACYSYNIKIVLYINTRHDYLWVIFKVVSLNTATWAQHVGEKEWSVAVEDLLCTLWLPYQLSKISYISYLSRKRLFRSITDHMCHAYTVNSFLDLSSYLTENTRTLLLKSRNITSKECPSGSSRVLPFQERERRMGRHDDANNHFSRPIWRCDWKCGTFTDISMVYWDASDIYCEWQ